MESFWCMTMPCLAPGLVSLLQQRQQRQRWPCRQNARTRMERVTANRSHGPRPYRPPRRPGARRCRRESSWTRASEQGPQEEVLPEDGARCVAPRAYPLADPLASCTVRYLQQAAGTRRFFILASRMRVAAGEKTSAVWTRPPGSRHRAHFAHVRWRHSSRASMMSSGSWQIEAASTRHMSSMMPGRSASSCATARRYKM